MIEIKHISATILGILFIASAVISPHTAAAQSAENDCSLPDFNITSSTDIFAIAGESFSYYVVTDSGVSYEVDSGMPTGLSFSNGQITGTPDDSAVGDHEIVFSSSNDCGTTSESVNVTVLEADGAAAAGSAQNESTTDEGSGQAAASGESVALNDIPETGIVADTALTVMFYLLALLLVAGWFGRRLQYATAGTDGDDLSDLSVIPSLESRYNSMVSSMREKRARKRQRFGDGIKR